MKMDIRVQGRYKII